MGDVKMEAVPEQFPTNRNAIPRRSAIGLFVAAATWIGAVLAVPLARFALFPLRNRGEQVGWTDLGPIENFMKSSTPVARPVSIERRDGWEVTSGQQSVYVLAPKAEDPPRVISAVCPHLGCTVQWNAGQDQFNCPCHGGTYAPDGSRLAGPPNRGMDELPTRVQDGHLYVQFHSYRQLIAAKEVLD